MSQILDVIFHTSKFAGGHTQTFVVVADPLKFAYTQNGNQLTGQCGDFFDFLAIEPRSTGAFGGRKFNLNMVDGSVFECHGQVWSVGAPKGHAATRQVGAATLDELAKCYVFGSANVLTETLDAWLAANTPSTEYRKYEKRTTPRLPQG